MRNFTDLGVYGENGAVERGWYRKIIRLIALIDFA
jgi:hypothetical protein